MSIAGLPLKSNDNRTALVHDPVDRPILMQPAMVRGVLAGDKTQTRRVQGLDVVNENPSEWTLADDNYIVLGRKSARFYRHNEAGDMITHTASCPYGVAGDRLWVRENFRIISASEGYESGFTDDGECGGARIFFPATCTHQDSGDLIIRDDGVDEGKQAVRFFEKGGTQPSIHMPRWASRIDLEVLSIRIQRLQEISKADAIAEGATPKAGLGVFKQTGWSLDWSPIGTIGKGTKKPLTADDIALASPQAAFGNYINTIHGGENWNLKPQSLWDKNPWVWAVEFKRITP